MKLFLTAIFYLTILSGCMQPNEAFLPRKIATLEGCSLYMVDGGHDIVYTTICHGGKKQTADWDFQEGKVKRHRRVETTNNGPESTFQ